MKRIVLTVGVYDMLHIGHILLFKRAKELGDKLIVAVQDSDVILKYKPGTHMVYTTEERMFMVSTIKYVDEVVIYRDVDKDIQNIDLKKVEELGFNAEFYKKMGIKDYDKIKDQCQIF